MDKSQAVSAIVDDDLDPLVIKAFAAIVLNKVSQNIRVSCTQRVKA